MWKGNINFAVLTTIMKLAMFSLNINLMHHNQPAKQTMQIILIWQKLVMKKDGTNF